MRFSEFKKLRFLRMLVNLDDLIFYKSNKNKLLTLVKDPRSHQDNGTWLIHPIALSATQIFLVCPFCGGVHVHGKTTPLGCRTIHCPESDGAYYDIV